MDDWQAGGFGLYVHWPFCEAKCPYCDFNSHVATRIEQNDWRAAYLSEISRAAAELPGRTLNSVFFGGGTPSLMDPDTVDALVAAVRAAWPVANDLEVTLEANPSSVETGRFKAFRQAGVNRISVGVQALSDSDLRRLGRLHSVDEARRAIEIAQECFDRVNFDLIYARQDQSLADWSEELSLALSLAADHLSLYQLTIEPGTAFGARHARGGLQGLPDEDLAADMYDMTQELCGAAGLPAYEISNHAADFAACRHNLIYWRGGDYVGIGPGAHGRITLEGQRWATETHLLPRTWLSALRDSGTGEAERSALNGRERAEEYLIMALRLTQGADLSRFERLAGHPLDEKRVADLEDLGLVEQSAAMLRSTSVGRPILNSILRTLLA